MGARSNLNVAYLNGCLVLAGAIGMLTGSWSVFWMSLVALLLTTLLSGGIRPHSRACLRGLRAR